MLPDDFILGVAEQCRREKTFETVFYDGTIKTDQDFLESMQRPANVPVFIFEGQELLGFAWLNAITGNFAFAHFCMMRAAWGRRTEEVGKLMLDYWMSFRNESGKPILDLIIGVIPAFNVKAINYVQTIGFRRLGEIPTILPYKGARIAACVLYYKRATYGEEGR